MNRLIHNLFSTKGFLHFVTKELKKASKMFKKLIILKHHAIKLKVRVNFYKKKK